MIHIIDLRKTASSEAAVRTLEFFLADAKVRGDNMALVYHGASAGTKETRLKKAARKAIRDFRKSGKINFYIYGEDCDGDNPSLLYLCSKNPELEGQDFYGHPSPEYTLVCIQN